MKARSCQKVQGMKTQRQKKVKHLVREESAWWSNKLPGPYLGDCILLSPGWGLDTSVMGQGIGGGLVGAHKSSLPNKEIVTWVGSFHSMKQGPIERENMFPSLPFPSPPLLCSIASKGMKAICGSHQSSPLRVKRTPIGELWKNIVMYSKDDQYRNRITESRCHWFDDHTSVENQDFICYDSGMGYWAQIWNGDFLLPFLT